MWLAWRYDGSRWYRCPNPARSDGAFADMGACGQYLARTVEREYGIPTTWTGLTQGSVPSWTPPARKRRGRAVGEMNLEDA